MNPEPQIVNPEDLRQVLYKSPHSVLEMIDQMGGPERMLSMPKSKLGEFPLGFIQELFVVAMGCVGAGISSPEPYISMDKDRIPDINIAYIDHKEQRVVRQSLAEVTIYTPHSRKKSESVEDLILKKLKKKYPASTTIFVLVASDQAIQPDTVGLAQLISTNNKYGYGVILLHKTDVQGLSGMTPLQSGATTLIDQATKPLDSKYLKQHQDKAETDKLKAIGNPHMFWMPSESGKTADGKTLVRGRVFDLDLDKIDHNTEKAVTLFEHPDHNVVLLENLK